MTTDPIIFIDFDTVTRPDPSVYSLFATTKKSGKTKKSKKINRYQRDPSVYTQNTETSKKTEPSFLLGYDGEDAPGFRAGNSIYFTEDGLSAQGRTRLISYDRVDEEGEGGFSFYSQYYTTSSNNLPRDPSFYTTTHSSQESHQQFAFPDSNDVMSMISGGSGLYSGMEYGQGVYSGSHSTKKTKATKKSRKSSKSKKERKSKDKRSSQSRSYYSTYSEDQSQSFRSQPMESKH